MRLQGLHADDASGKVWTGATEDIAVALHQAERSGLSVEVLHHDIAARAWKVRLGGEQLTILETKLAGRPRAAKAAPTEVERAFANKYAASAEFLQQKWEHLRKSQIDAQGVIEFDNLQIGYAYGGVVNQATLPAHGEGLDAKVVIYNHTGTLSKRGAQELGQGPSKFDAPGVRASEQAPQGERWLASQHLDQALEVGRLELQTDAYRGTVVALEPRPQTLSGDWKAPGRQWRVKVRDSANVERWFYVDHHENLGGLGPGKLSDARAVAGDHFDALVARNLLVRADDPDLLDKLQGGDTLVWGGSPTAAWAGEAAIRPHGASATLLGDTRPSRDWPTLLREYEEITFDLATREGDVPAATIARKAEIEAMIAKAHSAIGVRRNTKPGAPYARGATGKRGAHDAQIEFGTPTKMEPTADGRVAVTVGTGETAVTTIYDQIVVAHGQDPSAPGAPGGLLGKGAADDGPVPAGTIALRPIYGPMRANGTRDMLGLESFDPPGVQLKGAAYASKRMAPWVEQSQRAAFVQAVDAMADDVAVTRDHGKVSEDSRTVSAGVEVQRDRIPRANEVTHAGKLRLAGPAHTLELDPTNHLAWDIEVRQFFAINLRAEGKWVRVARLGGGKSGAVVYRVWVDDTDVGVFKLFSRGGAAKERQMLKLLEHAKLKHMTPVKERGEVKIGPNTGFDGATLMDAAKGESVKEMIEAMPASGAARDAQLKKLKVAATRVALGLAEMHRHFESGESMTTASKLSDADHFLNRNFREPGAEQQQVRAALGADYERVKAQIEGPMLSAFLAADVPATVYHGDANAGNFILDDYKLKEQRFGQLSVIDVGSMQYSTENQRATKTGAADVGRFLGSLETLVPRALTPEEIVSVRLAFTRTYFSSYAEGRALDRTSYDEASKWYTVEMHVASLRADANAKAGLLSLLGLELTP